MTTFMIETETLTSTASTLESFASKIDNISSTVSGYNTSCEDFDFSSPKSIIANNIEACSKKIKNASSYVNNVVKSHTTLQNQMKFESTEEKEAKAIRNSQNTTSSNTGRSSGGSYSRSGGYYSGGGYSRGSSYGGGNYSGSSYYGSVYSGRNTNTQSSGSSTSIIKEKISDIKHTILDIDTIKDNLAKTVTLKAKYNKAGYAAFGGMLLIGCSTAIGNIGDIVEFTTNDGKKYRCIVIENTTEEETIKLYTNEEWKENNEENPKLKDNISKIENFGKYQHNTGSVDLTNLPAIGENTTKLNILDEDWTVVSTKINVSDYENVIEQNGIRQNYNSSLYGQDCLAFSYVHASNLYNGNTNDTAVDAGNYKHATEFNSYFSDNKADTLNKIYSEIVQGRPVVMQVNGNAQGTSRHFVTVVGFRNSVTDPLQLTEEDLLVIDAWDGKIERMDQSNSRFITTGTETGSTEGPDGYTGYYLRTLKP